MALQGIKNAGAPFLNACVGFVRHHPVPVVVGSAAAIVYIAKRQLISDTAAQARTYVHTNVYRKFMDASKPAKFGIVAAAVVVVAVVTVGVLAVRKSGHDEEEIGHGHEHDEEEIGQEQGHEEEENGHGYGYRHD